MHLIRWLLLPIAVVATFFLSLAAVGAVFRVVGTETGAYPTVGFVTALLVVLCAHLVAPATKIWASAVVLAIGAVLAWNIFHEQAFLNESAVYYAHFVVTVSGGIVGLVAGFVLDRRARSDITPERVPRIE